MAKNAMIEVTKCNELPRLFEFFPLSPDRVLIRVSDWQLDIFHVVVVTTEQARIHWKGLVEPVVGYSLKINNDAGDILFATAPTQWLNAEHYA